MVEIKICGMRDAANIRDIAGLKPNYLGFICWSGSPRFVGDTFSLSGEEREFKSVGVFVNQSLAEIENWIERLSLSVLQLHGDEDPAFCRELKSRYPHLEVWKAFPVLNLIPDGIFEYYNVVDRILFDTSSAGRGGSGAVFSWAILDQYTEAIPIVLSGGLSAENVTEALQLCKRQSSISILDFNSRIESSPGLKDVELARKVIQAVAG